MKTLLAVLCLLFQPYYAAAQEVAMVPKRVAGTAFRSTDGMATPGNGLASRSLRGTNSILHFLEIPMEKSPNPSWAFDNLDMEFLELNVGPKMGRDVYDKWFLKSGKFMPGLIFRVDTEYPKCTGHCWESWRAFGAIGWTF